MAFIRRPSEDRDGPEPLEAGYWHTTRRPLQILVFLLPLILAYEAGLAWLLRSEHGVLTNKAHESLLLFLDTLGVGAASGLFLGGIVIIVVLLVWHLLTRQPWRVDGRALGFMGIESLVLTVPLLGLGLLIQRQTMVATTPTTALVGLDLWSKLAISIGAGLYEELLFRMLLIAMVHTLLVDLMGARHVAGAAAAIIVSAAAFAWYHPLGDGSGGLSLPRLVFYLAAGIYFGLVYVMRGFGIVVGAHALYDVITVALLGGGGEA